MKLRDQPPLHLTYCLNVHPGEQWADNLAAIKAHTLAIRDRVAPGKPFGLGLRLSRLAAEALQQPDALAEFREFMGRESLYAFTVNGFPYGTFHGKPVKTAVYQPDWSTRERLDYTLLLADILSKLLPEDIDGSISTLPLGYAFPSALRPPPSAILHLAECAAGLHAIRAKTGREIHLGLEPEPDCLLETTDDMIRFFEGPLLEQGLPHLASRLSCTQQKAEAILRRHIGICFDTCHLAIQFEDLADSLTRLIDHGIRISKIQLSSALEVAPTETARQRLLDFVDPIYLHQVKWINTLPAPRSPLPASFPDLPLALASPLSPDALAQLWRIHFHLPLYFKGDGILNSTSKAMDTRFWQKLKAAPISHLEIETYTFNVLPKTLQAGGIESSITREYDWVINSPLTSTLTNAKQFKQAADNISQFIQRTLRGRVHTTDHMGVNHGRFHALMAQIFLNFPNIHTFQEHIRGKGVPQGVDRCWLSDAHLLDGRSHGALKHLVHHMMTPEFS